MNAARHFLSALAALALSLPAAYTSDAQTTSGGVPPMFPLASALAPQAGSGLGSPAGALQLEGTTAEDGRKSIGLGVLYSLLLPGMGELYAGGYGSGKYFTAAEGVLWLTLGAIDLHARSMQDDARSFAAIHAGFDPAGKNDSYYINIGNFTDIWSYNEQVLRDRDAYKLYDPQSPAFWEWDSDANRDLYREQRVASDQMFNNTRFVAAAIAINHVLSAINAARLIVSGNRSLGTDGSLDIGANVLGGFARPHGIALSFTRHF
jgi:hypothetical protein